MRQTQRQRISSLRLTNDNQRFHKSDLADTDFGHCSFDRCSFSGSQFENTHFSNGSYLFAIDFSHCDLTQVEFDNSCAIRSYNRATGDVRPFNLSHTKLSAKQLLRFIKRGVVAIEQINWSIQDEEVQRHKAHFIALVGVMYANPTSERFSVEALRQSLRLSGRRQNQAQCLIDRIDLNKSTDTPHYVSMPTISGMAFADVIYTLEQQRLNRMQQRRQTPGLSGYFLHDYRFRDRCLDHQLLQVDEYKQCSFINSSLQNVCLEDAVTTFHDNRFEHCQIGPISLQQHSSSTRLQLIKFSNSQFEATNITGVSAISDIMRFEACRFTQASTLSGVFTSASFSHKCQLIKTKLEGQFNACSFSGAEFTVVQLKGDFTKSTFTYTVFNSCDLSHSNFKGSHFDNAKLNAVDLRNIRFDGKTSLKGAQLKNCVINSHALLLKLMLIDKVDISDLDWKKMPMRYEPYQRIKYLYQQAQRVGEGMSFLRLIFPAKTSVPSMQSIEALLHDVGRSRHSCLSLFHRDRNHYFNTIKHAQLDASAPSPQPS